MGAGRVSRSWQKPIGWFLAWAGIVGLDWDTGRETQAVSVWLDRCMVGREHGKEGQTDLLGIEAGEGCDIFDCVDRFCSIYFKTFISFLCVGVLPASHSHSVYKNHRGYLIPWSWSWKTKAALNSLLFQGNLYSPTTSPSCPSDS